VNGEWRSREKMPFSAKNPPLENRLIGDILREYPQVSDITQRYFGEHCPKRRGFKVQTLEMACILFCVDQNRLSQELEKIRN
jgi:hypothetical protein